MSGKPKVHRLTSLRNLASRLRDDLNGGNQDFVLLYAYNGTGKTRLSMEFKDAGKRKNKGQPDTLYFNAFAEDLFSRAPNFLSHGKYGIYQPSEMVDDNKRLFRQILAAFLGRYEFALPDIFDGPAARKGYAA